MPLEVVVVLKSDDIGKRSEIRSRFYRSEFSQELNFCRRMKKMNMGEGTEECCVDLVEVFHVSIFGWIRDN